MKTQGFLFILFVLSIFPLGQINAQTKSEKNLDVFYSVWIPCAEENAEGFLTIHAVTHYDKDGNITKFHRQPMAGELTGQVTGTLYHAVGKTQTQQMNQYTFTDTFRMVGVGPDAATYSVQTVNHFTYNAKGELTAEVVKSTVKCE